jgi:hypothetical protein
MEKISELIFPLRLPIYIQALLKHVQDSHLIWLVEISASAMVPRTSAASPAGAGQAHAIGRTEKDFNST